MKSIKKSELTFSFDRTIYESQSPYFITSDFFWDGGLNSDSTLKDKKQFYLLTCNMSEIIKNIVRESKEDVYASQYFCENNNIYAGWSDLKEKELFCNISSKIKKNKYYKLDLPEDNEIIDLIVESNFNYYTFISLFLPKTHTVLLPTCHTEILVYSKNDEQIEKILKKSIKEYNDIIRYCK